MYTHTSTKREAERIAKAVERISGKPCEVTKDCDSWRISSDDLSGDIIRGVQYELEEGKHIREITLETVLSRMTPKPSK